MIQSFHVVPIYVVQTLVPGEDVNLWVEASDQSLLVSVLFDKDGMYCGRGFRNIYILCTHLYTCHVYIIYIYYRYCLVLYMSSWGRL